MTKKEARKIAKVSSLNKDFNISKLIIDSNILDRYTNIGIYYPIKSEYSVLDLMEYYKDKKFYFPRVTSRDSMKFIESKTTTNFIKSNLNVFEPLDDNSNEDSKIEVYIIPCLGVSKKKRIGYGMGFYDRYLENKKVLKIGIVNKNNVFENVDMDQFDISLDYVFMGE